MGTNRLMNFLESFRIINGSLILKYVGIFLIALTFNTLVFDINLDRISDYKEDLLRAFIISKINFQTSIIYKDLSPHESIRQINQSNAEESLANMNDYDKSLQYVNTVESRLKKNKNIATSTTIILLLSAWLLERRNIILARMFFLIAISILMISIVYFTYENFYVPLPPLPSFK